MKVRTKSTLALGAGVVAVAGLVASPMAFAAQVNTTSNTTVCATIGSTISVTSSPLVTISITPVSGGGQAAATDTVTVNTNNATGYVLNLKDGDATNTLAKGTDNIPATAGTFASPIVLVNNTWGFAIGQNTSGATISSANFSTAATYTGTPSTGDVCGRAKIFRYYYGVQRGRHSKPVCGYFCHTQLNCRSEHGPDDQCLYTQQ